MRYCPHCRRLLPLRAFYVHKTRGRQAQCKACQARASRRWYLKNRSLVIARARAQKDNNKRQMVEYLRAHPCVDCGETDVLALEFDHVRGKRSTVSILAHSTTSWARIRDEIGRCQVRCANCHRRRTARQYGWKWRLRRDLGPRAKPPSRPKSSRKSR